MPFDTSSFGPYTWTFNAVAVGMIEGVPIEQFIPESIDRRASLFGSSVVDTIETGGQMFLTLIVKEWAAKTKTMLWPWGGTPGAYGIAGRSGLDLSLAIVATALAGTPAAANGPVTRTWTKCKLAGGHNTEIKFGCDERNIPLTFRVFPVVSLSAGTITWYTDT